MSIPILVTLDENYIPQLNVLLVSLYINHPGQSFDIYLVHSRISKEKIAKIDLNCRKLGFVLFSVRTNELLFENAPITKRYPKEMYYRLLAAQILPQELDKIIYIDPDTLVINSILPLWKKNINDYLFAAAAHTGKTELVNSMNRIRLGTETDYFNSGVLLINLKRCRKEIVPEEVFEFAREHFKELLLPDQDILNALYGNRILEIEDVLWNYDARNYSNYLLRSAGEWNVKWVMKHTAILHFCGREKPWKDNYSKRFGALYRHYMNLSAKYLEE